MRRTTFLVRPVYTMALTLAALGVAGMAAVPAEAQDKKGKDKPAAAAKPPQPSKEFIPVFTDLRAALDAASKRPDVLAAKAKVTAAEQAYKAAGGARAREAARPAYDTAVAELGTLLAPEKAKVDNAYAKATTPADKFYAGQLGFNFGQTASDKMAQRQGLSSMISSGLVPAADVGKYHYYVAGFSFDMKDYAAAETSLKAAIAAGNSGNDVIGLLAEAQNSAGRPADALVTIKGLVDNAVAAGQAPNADWLERAVLISYNNKLNSESVYWALRRVEFYPTQAGLVAAGQIIREKGNFAGDESLDISRALDRAGALNTNSRSVEREYVEYLQAAVGKVGVLYPGEVIKIANQGVRVGALKNTDIFVRDSLAEANRRVAADRASLAGLERDARGAAATAKTVLIAADTFLSYEQFDKAADLYKIALAKPGADQSAVNLRLGMALTKMGMGADAQTALAKVQGPRKPIADLWTLIAKGKVIPAA